MTTLWKKPLFKFYFLAGLFLLLILPSMSIYSATEKNQTENNEKIVMDFYTKIFIERLDIKTVAEQYLTEDYIQHNPNVPTGRQGFIDGLSGMLPKIPNGTFNIKRVINDDDMVVLHIHLIPESGHRGYAGVDIFRVDKNGKIAEHWDVGQEIPEKMAHDNTMF